MRRIWHNWWMQLVAGLLITAIVVLPWLWIGEEDRSILPHASDDAQGLLVVFSVITLWGSWFARSFGYGRTAFTVVASVGMILGLLGLGFQGLHALEPGLLGGELSAASIRHLWVFGGLLLISQAWYFLATKLRLPIAVLFYATLTVGVSYWLQIIASLFAGAQSYYVYLWYAGPLILGLILGFVGFLRIMNLLMWVLALAIQWAMPAVVESTARVIESKATGWDAIGSFWKEFAGSVLDVPWQTPLLVSLATAMLTSVVLLIVRKVRRR
ncbi:hypothetical protein [Glutamicibacter sp. HZAU]|uniref:hypothetical protein n=1 Tax=Glutamicibacter sp. HZAU TaxID=2049891 RepID=UPI000FFBD897|nr:hypothetical protein [Glutamicibacter sp. HZAU]RWZ85034.1 hypothetical protein EKH49_00550 [Glutamicibacter sp. HZAU]